MKVQVKISSLIIIFSLFLINVQGSFSIQTNKLIDYIKLKQIWDLTDEYGGFKNSDVDDNASVETTGKAILSLSELNVVNQTIYESAISYITGCEQFGGGYSADSAIFVPNLRSTFWAVNTLNSIKSMDWISDETANWIVNRQLLNESEPWNYGGFENKVNASSAMTGYTFYGLMALNYMIKLNSVNATAATFWLKSRQQDDGGFEDYYGLGISDLASTFYSVSALNILDGLTSVNKTSLSSFLAKKQNLNLSDPRNYGGFGNTPNISCNVIDTFFAIKSLCLINAIEKINTTAAYLYLKNLQLSNGGFAFAREIEQASVSFSYFALMTLNLLLFEEEGYDSLIFLIIGIIICGAISSTIFIKKRRKSAKSLKNFRKQKFSNLSPSH